MSCADEIFGRDKVTALRRTQPNASDTASGHRHRRRLGRGHLALATPLLALEQGLPMPAAIVALSPILDMDLTAKDAQANARLDPMVPAEALGRLVDLLLPDADLSDPRLSPINADLRSPPAALICAGSTEFLYSDAERMTSRLTETGVPANLEGLGSAAARVRVVGAPLIPEAQQIGKPGLDPRPGLGLARIAICAGGRHAGRLHGRPEMPHVVLPDSGFSLSRRRTRR